MLANENRLRDSVKTTCTARDKGWQTTVKLSIHICHQERWTHLPCCLDEPASLDHSG